MARDEYRAARYQGDLAFDVLPSRISIAARWAIGAVAAVAAVVIVTVTLHLAPTPANRSPSNVALVTPAEPQTPTSMTATPFSISAESLASGTETSDAELPLAAAPPEPPTDVTTLVPSYQSTAVESVPSFPSLDSVIESAQQQQQDQPSQEPQNSSDTRDTREAS